MYVLTRSTAQAPRTQPEDAPVTVVTNREDEQEQGGRDTERRDDEVDAACDRAILPGAARRPPP